MLLWYVSVSSELHFLAAKTWESKALSAISLGRQLSSVSSKTILRISILPAAADLLLLSTAQILGMGSFWLKCLKAVFSSKLFIAWWHPDILLAKYFDILVVWNKDKALSSDALSIDESKSFPLVFVVFFLKLWWLSTFGATVYSCIVDVDAVVV